MDAELRGVGHVAEGAEFPVMVPLTRWQRLRGWWLKRRHWILLVAALVGMAVTGAAAVVLLDDGYGLTVVLLPLVGAVGLVTNTVGMLRTRERRLNEQMRAMRAYERWAAEGHAAKAARY